MPAKRATKCPTCKKTGDWFDGPWGPFCSRRCKMVDLGKWLGEENVISQPLPDDDEFARKELPDEAD